MPTARAEEAALPKRSERIVAQSTERPNDAQLWTALPNEHRCWFACTDARAEATSKRSLCSVHAGPTDITLGLVLTEGSYSWARRSNCALIATMTVLADIRTAAIAGGRRMPCGARTPAANGIATML
jgi:hypothetical protein